MVKETDLELNDGRRLHIYDTRADGAGASLAVFWQHGTPNLGEPPEPLLPSAAERGIRWVSYDRPRYGGSTPHPGRDVARRRLTSRLSPMHWLSANSRSWGIPAVARTPWHAARCCQNASSLPCPSPDWLHSAPRGWIGSPAMAAAGEAELRAAEKGRPALEDYLASTEFDPQVFTPADHAALAGAWSWLGAVAGRATRGGLGGMVDDDLAYVAPSGFDPGQVNSPVLILQGGQDRIAPSSHGRWLARRIRSAELWLRPDDGHISVLNSGAAAMEWLLKHAGA